MKHKLLSLFVALIATTALWAGNTITYTATLKLEKITLTVGKTTFGPAIKSHTFSNGTGTITCSGEIVSIGTMAFSNCGGLISITIPNSVTTIEGWAFSDCNRFTSVTIPNSVTTIGDYAFYNCNVLTSVTIGNSVTTIGNWAFRDCKGLTSVTIPNSVTTIGDLAFDGCSGLTSIDVNTANTHYTSIDGVLFNYTKDTLIQCPICNPRTEYTIPNSVTTIGEYAFSGCKGLTSVTIPNSVTTIMNDAFAHCTGLTSVTIGNSVTTMEDGAFSGCSGLISITIPNSVTTIGRRAFSGCISLPVIDNIRYADSYLVEAVDKTLSTYIIKEGTKWIGEYAFSDCGDLTSITIPNSVTMIGDGAFSGCSGLTSITIPNSVITIGYSAFYGCSGLTSITIPNSVITIGHSAFYGCSGLTSVTIPNSVITIGDEAFEGCISLPVIDNIRYADSYLVEAVDKTLSTYIIKEGTKWIGEYAFSGCSGLISITIPNSVTTIGRRAFSGCSGLTSVTIPNSVTIIGGFAFNDCFSLISIAIPSSVTTIGECAFENVNNIVYSGTATGSPWGAKCVNGYVDGYLVYTDATKTTLVGCSTAATGKLIVPMSVGTIKENAFSGCNRLDSVYIENYFMEYDKAAFPSTTKIKVLTSITAEQTSKNLCSATVHMTISEALKNYYDEIGLTYDHMWSSYKVKLPNTQGDAYFSLAPATDEYCSFYAKKGTQKVTKGSFVVSTETPSVSCGTPTVTQTTITINNITASTDTSVHSLGKGIYYNYKRYEADEDDKVVITGIVPNTKCTLQVYGCYNGNYYYGADLKYVTTQAIAPTLTVTESPTCIYAKGSYTHGDATILSTSMACTTTGSSVAGDEGLMTGLKPNTSYSFTYSVDTKEGGTYTATKTITTPALTLTTLVPKVVSSGKVVVAASTNISDLETNVGFEWRKYNAPPELPSSRAQAILYKGQMEGILHNLSLEYWKVRAYYEAADGTCYYGEWATFDPSQPAFFEPTVHTYALVTDPTANKVQMRGYVMTGTDDVTEQGFEYWFKGSKAPRRVASATPDSVYRVQASGQVMTAVLEDLAYSTTYTCRAYAVAGGKTYYGEEVQFLTPEDPRPIYTLSVTAGENGSVNTDISGQYREGETVTLTATAEQGFRFMQWSDGNTDNPRQLTITANTELVAFFELADGLEWLTVDNARCTIRKMIIDNQLFIFRGGKIYNAAGVEL